MLSALAAEVEALTRLINHRKFFDGFVETGAAALAEVEAGRGDEPGAFLVFSMQHRYFVVYEALVGKLGLLDPYMADRITRFYIYAKAVQENYDPKSPFSDGASNSVIVQVIESDLQLLHTVITLGQHIATFRSAAPPPGIIDPFPADPPVDHGMQTREPALTDGPNKEVQMPDAEMDELKRRLVAMSEAEVAEAFNRSEPGSKEADIIADELDRRNIDF